MLNKYCHQTSYIFHCSHHELLPKVLYQPDPLQFTAMSVSYDVEEPGAMWCHNPIWICNHKGNTATYFSIQDPIYFTLDLKDKKVWGMGVFSLICKRHQIVRPNVQCLWSSASFFTPDQKRVECSSWGYMDCGYLSG